LVIATHYTGDWVKNSIILVLHLHIRCEETGFVLFTGKTGATVLEDPSLQKGVEIKKNIGQARAPVIELGSLKPDGSLEVSYSES
jgi:hypothetical protein